MSIKSELESIADAINRQTKFSAQTVKDYRLESKYRVQINDPSSKAVLGDVFYDNDNILCLNKRPYFDEIVESTETLPVDDADVLKGVF